MEDRLRPPLHPWTLDPHRAMVIQDELRQRLDLTWDGRPVKTVGVVDIHIKADWARASLVILRFP